MRARVTIERFALREAFTIARGAKREVVVVVATVEAHGYRGRGEAVPYPRYGETPERVVAQIEGIDVASREELLDALPASAARNALDLALWDLECKSAGRPIWELMGEVPPKPVPILATIPILDPDTTRRRARKLAKRPVLKLKLGASEDIARARAAREGAPDARLVVDANEGWDLPTFERMTPVLADLGVELVEQPLPAGEDRALKGWEGPFLLCADESCHGCELDALADRYGAVNIKLDKQGGLTGALRAVKRAEQLDLDVFLGCMVSSSLAIAPALLLARRSRWIDLDGATFLQHDRPDGLRVEAGVLHPGTSDLWG